MFNDHENIFDCDGWDDYDDDYHDDVKQSVPSVSYPEIDEEFYFFTHEHDC